MKGVGSYNDWPYYAPSSSNLSAFAQPFSVNPSTSKDVSRPVVDLAESADAVHSNDFAVRSHSAGCDFLSNPVTVFDSTPSTKAYVCSNLHVMDSNNTQSPQFNSVGLASKDAFAYDQYYNSIKTSLVEAQPYYPSFIPPPFHDGNFSVAHSYRPPSSVFTSFDGSSLSDHVKRSSQIDDRAQMGGSWNRFGQFNQEESKQVENGASFGSKESNIVTGSLVEGNLMNQGRGDSESLHKGELLNGISTMSWEKHGVPFCTNQLDDKFSRWPTSNSMPIYCASTSVQGSPLVSLETHNETPFNSAADSGKDHSFYSDSYEKYLGQHDELSWVDTESSAPMTGLVRDLNVGSDTTDRDLGINIIPKKKEPRPLPTSGNTGYFDASQLHMHLEWNDPTLSASNAVLSDKNASKNDTNFVFKATCGFSNPHVSLNNLNLTLNTNEDVNAVEKSFDSVDHRNPAVDSPCWKGASATHYSPFEAYETSSPEYMKITGKCFDSNFQRAQSFLLNTDNNVKIAAENSNNNQMHSESGYQEKGLAESLRKFPATNFLSEEFNSVGRLDAGPCQSKSNCDSGLPYIDDTSEMRQNTLSQTKPTSDCKANTGQQVMEENKFRSPKKHAECRGFACTAAGCNVNEYLEYGKSDAVEHALSSTSEKDSSTELTKSVKKVSNPKINVQILVDTMCNLSELLLAHFSNDTHELREQDHSVLKNVITNLNACISKSAEKIIPAQECLFLQPGASKCARELPEPLQSAEQMIPPHECHYPQPGASKCARESPRLLLNTSFEGPQLDKFRPECTNFMLESPCVQEEKNCHFMSGKQHQSFADSFPKRGVAEMMKEENMTKALKKILSDNFHDDKGAESQTLLYKNLWVEAEAALCSISYKARYNQVKNEMEMEMYSCKQRGVEDLSGMEVFPNSSTSPKCSSKVSASLNPDYFAHDLPALNAASVKQLPASKLSLDLNKPDLLAPEEKSGHSLDTSVLDSPASNINKDAGDCEASVMSRFHVLKSRFDNLFINSDDLEDLSSSEASLALDSDDNLASGGMDNKKQASITLGDPVPNKNKANDFDTSVMARFHMLKSGAESLSSVCSEGTLLDGVKLPANVTDCTVIETASEAKGLDDDVNRITRHLTSYPTLNGSNPMEFLPNLEYDQETQSRGTYGLGYVFPTYYSDGLSSEWEHVRKEGELPGKNSEPELE